MTTATEMAGLESLEDLDILPLRMQGVGFRFLMGEMPGIQTVIPVVDLVQLSVDHVVDRQDYTLEGDDPGNRIISKPHVKKIKEGLKKHAKKLVLGTFILAVDPDGLKIEKELASTGHGAADIAIVRFGIRSGNKLFILDAQHRNNALQELWDDTIEAVRSGDLAAREVAELLRKSSVPILIVAEGERNEISRLFVTLASTKPISPSLIAVMDRESMANRFGLAVAQNAKLLGRSERLAYQTSTATGDDLYAAAAVRGAAASVFIGFRDRSPEMREENLVKAQAKVMDEDGKSEAEAFDLMVEEVVELLDYAYVRLPGWKELSEGKEDFDAKKLRSDYVHGAASGLYVIAGVLCAARHAPGVDPKRVIDSLASEVEWQKNKIVKIQDSGVYRHPSFEETLVVTEPELDDDGNITAWNVRTGGGNRTAYEKATRNVLEALVKADSSLAELTSPAVLGEVGLAPRVDGPRRGRPRKAAAVTV